MDSQIVRLGLLASSRPRLDSPAQVLSGLGTEKLGKLVWSGFTTREWFKSDDLWFH